MAIYEQREMDMLFRHKTQIYLNIFFSIQLKCFNKRFSKLKKKVLKVGYTKMGN